MYRQSVRLPRSRGQILCVQAFLREEHGLDGAPAKEAAVQVDERLHGGLRPLKLHEDAHCLCGVKARLGDLEDGDVADGAVLAALLPDLVLQAVVHLACTSDVG